MNDKDSTFVTVKNTRRSCLFLTLLCWFVSTYLVIAFWTDATGIMFAMMALTYVIIFSFGAKIHLSKAQFDPLDPFWGFIGVYSIYAWSGILSVELNAGMTYVGTQVSAEAKYVYYILINLGLLGFIIGYHWAFGRSLTVCRGVEMWFKKIPPGLFANVILAVAVIFSLVFLQQLLQSIDPRKAIAYIERGGMIRLEWAADDYSGLKNYIQHLPITILLAALYLRIEKNRPGIWGLIFAVCIAFYALSSLSSGGRGGLIICSFLILSFYHYYVKKLRLSVLLAIALPLYFIGVTIQHVRSFTDLQIMFQHAVSLIIDSPGLLIPSSIGEFAAPTGNLLILIDSVNDGSMSYTWGYSILSDIALFLPRFLFPGRPLASPELFTKLALPDWYFYGHGAGFFILMDGYWSFGVVGVLLEMVAWGALVGLFYLILLRNLSYRPVLLLYSLSYPIIVVFSVRTGLIGSLKSAMMELAPFMLIMLALGVANSRKSIHG